jgi:peptidoglycan hydrolase-like protein with peptidoglycan-binding domain
VRLLSAAGGLAARHPRPLLSGAGFVVLFSFVSANALWYQPSGHPAPFLATRDPRDPNAIAGYRPQQRSAPGDVTTFRIERAPNSPTPAAPFPAALPTVPQTVAVPAPPALDSSRQLVSEVQRELTRRGLYDGADDGVTGARTQAAILFYQETAGLPQTGEATPDLLAALKAEPRAPATGAARNGTPTQPAIANIPKPTFSDAVRSQPQKVALPTQSASVQPPKGLPANRPAENVSMRGEDPVAAAIRSAEHSPAMVPPADIPGNGWKAAAHKPAAPVPASDLVLQIQKGLSNIAYTDVEVDGVAGSQTKAAIRRFEKHYRLPETGEPNEMVLKKLRAIGAL